MGSLKRRKKRGRNGEETVFTISDQNDGQWRGIDFSLPERLRSGQSGQADGSSQQGRSQQGRSQQKTPSRAAEKNRAGKRKHVGSEPGEKDAVGLRIIGGKFRGSKLRYTGDNRVRPMKDRVRESLFNLIGPGVKGKYVIDLFGGTGALMIEAISRGAVGGTMIEMHFPTARNARQNLQSLDLESICRLVVTDAFYWSHLREGTPDDIPWIVFCSPPYDFYVQKSKEMRGLLERLHAAAPEGSLFVVESDERFDFDSLPVTVDPKRRRSYPPAEIGIFHVGTG
ncbi:MAG TPA: SAM-dependent methyltransferase [Planctomycetaceae bacterium]|nr:SAM-dependent methyltransferase [Planctomycetaceae bacterium]